MGSVLPYSFNFGKLRLDGSFLQPFAMMGDTKTMGLIAELLNNFERFGSLVQVDGYLIIWKINFLQPFGNTNDGNFTI